MNEISEPDKKLAIEILVKMYESRYVLAKQAEDQRATMSNFIITIAAVMFAFISQQGFSKKTILISILTILLGVFGLFMSAKYSQHYIRNYGVAATVRNRIAELCPQAGLLEIEHKALDKSAGRYPFLSKVPTLYLWVALHSSICVIGALCILLAVFQ